MKITKFNPLYTINEDTRVEIPECNYSDYIKRTLASQKAKIGATVCSLVRFTLGFPDAFDEAVGSDPEEYGIFIGDTVEVYAATYDGFLRAMSTLMQMNDGDGLTPAKIYDKPACGVRGHRVYMPGHTTLYDFRDMLDFLVYYKYSSIILEIGGAMEYKRHPIINEKWVEFCRDMGEYSGKADDVQASQRWAKNSIHYENGDGEYLTQEECQLIVEWCRERGIEIIPECPTLSHADYICMAYPELAERQDDPYPDVYCPSNPKSYEVVFDILDEVIEVFKPKAINIGHDEFYSVGICERCRGKSNSSLYAEDVRKIKEYLEGRGIATYMWGEKLLKARFVSGPKKGNKIGGWYEMQNYNGTLFKIPDMYDCADKLPRGVTYLHWYWEFGEHLDDEFHCREYPVVFGNFSALSCDNYRVRINRGVKGGFVSNWGSCAPEYMQRNFIYRNLASSGYALWSDSYDDSERDAVKARADHELYNRYLSGIKHPITVRHSTDFTIKPEMFWCGRYIVDEVYMLGKYELTYENGEVAYLPVKFGTNIGTGAVADGARIIGECSYSTLAHKTGGGYVYEHAYENPHPELRIKSIKYIPEESKRDFAVTYEFDGIEKTAGGIIIQ